MKYSEIINISADFTEVYDADNEKKDEWKRYIITKEFSRTLENVLVYFSTNKKKSFWIQGTYGTGKSHTLAVFKHLLCDDYLDIEPFINRVESAQLRSDFLEFRKNKKFFPVILSGIYGINDSLSMSQIIQTQVKKAIIESGENIPLDLLTDLEQMKKIVQEERYSSMIEELLKTELFSYCSCKEELLDKLNNNNFEVFKIIEKYFKKDGLNISSTGDINDWLLEVNEKIKLSGKYDGLVIYWDEFTSILELSDAKALLVEIQQIATLANRDIYLFIVTHKLYNAIDGFKNLIKEDQKKIEDRFSIEKFEIDTLTNYTILSNALNIINRDKIKELVAERIDGNLEVSETIEKIVGNKGLKSSEIKNQIKNLYPFHPFVSFSSTNLARIVGSAKRSVFQFLNDSKFGFLDFIENEIDREKYLTIDRMWDFFFTKFQDEPKYSAIINTFIKNDGILSDLCEDAELQMYKNILKCTLLLNILQESISIQDDFNERALLSPSINNIKMAYSGVYNSIQVENVLSKFNEKGIVNRNPRDEYTVTISNIAPEKVESEKKVLIQQYKDIKTILENDYAQHLISFKDGITASFLRLATISFLPYNIPDGGLGQFIDKEFSSIEYKNNIKIVIFLKRGFDDKNNQFVDELSEEELKAKIIDYSKSKKSNIIFLIVKNLDFGLRRYNSWIDIKAREKIALQNNNFGEQKDYRASGEEWIKEYINYLRQATFSIVFRDQCVDKVYNDISSTIQDNIVTKIIYKFGLENLKFPNTVFKKSKKPNSATIEKLLKPTLNEVKGLSKSTALPSNLQYLLRDINDVSDIFDEEMKLISSDVNHPIVKMINEVDKVLDECKNLTEIDLSEKLDFLFDEPYGFYNCACYNGALALCLRKYINKIRLVNAKAAVVNESRMKDIIISIFDSLIYEKSSNDSKVRFSTEAEVKLIKNLATVFGVDIKDDSTLQSVKWQIRNSFENKHKAPLWVLKYFTENIDLKLLIDKLFKFTVTIDTDFSEDEIKNLSNLFEKNMMNFVNLLTEIKKDDCFKEYLKINEKNSGKNDQFIDDELKFLKDKMKAENNFKSETEVDRFIDEYFQEIERKNTKSDHPNNKDDVITGNTVETKGGTIIIPGLNIQQKKQDISELMIKLNLSEGIIQFIDAFINEFPEIIDYVLKYLKSN